MPMTIMTTCDSRGMFRFYSPNKSPLASTRVRGARTSMKSAEALRRTTALATFMQRHRIGPYLIGMGHHTRRVGIRRRV